MKEKEIKQTVKEAYAKIATKDESCCCFTDARTAEEISKSIGYSNKGLHKVPEANLGLGCGNPTAFGKIREGDVVLDLGSGAGLDCFLASARAQQKKRGSCGRQSVSRMKTDSNSLGTDTAALLPNAYTGFRLSTLVDYHIQDT